MSWLLGDRRYKKPEDFSDFVPNDAGNQPPINAKPVQMEAYRFDPSALERAATAAKDLEKSGKKKIKNIIV